jgi:predicted O-linked N-acetylglucosamine transferase (SPINDLY family)
MAAKILVATAHIDGLLERGLQWHRAGELMQAKSAYQQILQLEPRHFDALHLLGVVAAQTNNPQLAEGLIAQALRVDPLSAIAHANRGNALQALGRLDEALACYEQAIAIAPDYAEAFNNRGYALERRGRLDEAIASYDKAISLWPDYADAFNNRGNALHAQKRSAEALASYDQAITLRPDYAEAFNNRGTCLQDMARTQDALISYDRAISLRPGYAEAHNNRGVCLQDMGRLQEALLSFDKAIALRPDYPDPLNNRGSTLRRLTRLEEALADYDKALSLKPDYAEALYNRGHTLQDLKRLEPALESYKSASTLKPTCDFLLGTQLHLQMRLCDWSQLPSHLLEIQAGLAQHRKVIPPFELLGLLDHPGLQLQAARIYAASPNTPAHRRVAPMKIRPAEKIRVGYYSADFHNHATTYLMAELFEAHDRDRFEIYGFSFGPERNDEMRRRVSAQFHQFFDIRNLADQEVAQMSEALGIHIAVDLKGYTQDGRVGIFAHRCAPIQVSYLGYPGTMGTDFFEYIVADKIVIPEASRPYYSEQVVYLPHSYQVNDSKRTISDKVGTRADAGLPDSGFVFCCFNNNYKILPATLDAWVRILEAVEDSVLWLLDNNPSATKNLRKEAQARGLHPDRLVFAKKIDPAEHLARHRLAGLFLDTLPYNAHTTASDALWAGVPVLTCVGRSFPARVAASLLNAMDLPELIAQTQNEYEATAIDLALNPAKLAAAREKVVQRRKTSPLFNGALFARHLEAAYVEMYRRERAGEGPADITIC